MLIIITKAIVKIKSFKVNGGKKKRSVLAHHFDFYVLLLTEFGVKCDNIVGFVLKCQNFTQPSAVQILGMKVKDQPHLI